MVHLTDAGCFERLQTLRLCDGQLPLGVAPSLHRLFVTTDTRPGATGGETLLAAAAGARHRNDEREQHHRGGGEYGVV